MNRDDLIKQCRYYHGEDKNPFSDRNIAWFWDMERVYVNHNGKFVGESVYYHNIHGREYTGIPFDLLMIMFTSWSKWAYDIKNEIGDFYELMELYLDFVSDNIQKDKIPNS